VEHPPSESCYALAEQAKCVVVVCSAPSEEFRLREWARLHRIDFEIAERIHFCVLDPKGALPFEDESFGQVVVGAFQQQPGPGKFNKLSARAWEKLISNLTRSLEPGGEMCIFADNTSLKTALSKRRLPGSFSWATPMLCCNRLSINTVLHFYPSLGNVTVVTNRQERCGVLAAAREAVRRLLKSEGAMILCRKATVGTHMSVVEQVVERIEAECGYRNSCALRLTKGSGGAFVLQTKDSIVRLPRLWRSEIKARWSNNFDALVRLGRVRLPFQTPRACFKEEVSGQPYSVEARLGGKADTGKSLSYPKSQRLSSQAVDYLIALFKNTCSVVILRKEEFLSLFTEPIRCASRHFNEAGMESLRNLNDRLAEEFIGTEIPLVTTHGDFKRSNFLFDERGDIDGIFDWDLSRSPGLPLLDLYLFLGFEDDCSQAADIPGRIMARFVDKSPLENDLVSRYVRDTHAMPETKLRHLALLTVIYYLAYHRTVLDATAETRNGLDGLLIQIEELTSRGEAKLQRNCSSPKGASLAATQTSPRSLP
jgi:hypothetical protein